MAPGTRGLREDVAPIVAVGAAVALGLWCCAKRGVASGVSKAVRKVSIPTGGAAPVIFCGPSGVGKGTIIGKLRDRNPQNFGFAISHTTRGPRDGETDGVHYHFSTKEKMLAMVEAGEFIEHAHVHANIYGTSRAAVETVQSDGKICILDIDCQGAKQIKEGDKLPGCRYVFIRPPSMDALEQRLRGRGTESEDKIQLRMKNAIGEMTFSNKDGWFDQVTLNENLDDCVADVEHGLKEWFFGLTWNTGCSSTINSEMRRKTHGFIAVSK